MLPSLLVLPGIIFQVPLPTASQVAWMDREVGALFQFNIGEYGTEISDYACSDTSQPPIPASKFTPMALNTTAWMETASAMGAKQVILTAQAGCGFDLWFTNVTLGSGSNTYRYNYTVRESPFAVDIVQQFVDAARAAGIRPGLYYIINNNYFLSYRNGAVQPRTSPQQVPVTNAQYEALVLLQLRELWSAYGTMVELWFDGGCPPSLRAKVSALLTELQPQAVRFQGPSNAQAVRWIGSESGFAPEPNWITAHSSLDYGPGEASGAVVAPSEADTPLARTGEWYWKPGQPVKSLSDLSTLYDDSVGHNSNLLLDVPIDYSGAVAADSATRLAEFGDWVKSCYSTPTARTSGTSPSLTLTVTLTLDGVTPISRLWLAEDLAKGGQRVRNFTLAVQRANEMAWVTVASGYSIGHKRIVSLAGPITALAAARVTLRSPGGGVYLKDFAAFADKGCALSPDPSPSAPCTLVPDYLYTGQPLGPALANATTVAECCAACRAVAAHGCVAFGFTPAQRRGMNAGCQLLKAVGGGKKVVGAVSGSPAASEGSEGSSGGSDAASLVTRENERPVVQVLGTVDLLLVEQTPVVYRDRLLRFESIRSEYYDNHGPAPYFRFTDALTGAHTPSFATNYSFGSAMVDNRTGVVYVTGTLGYFDSSSNPPALEMVRLFWSSDGMQTWSNTTVIDWSGAGAPKLRIYNTAIARGKLGNGTEAVVVAFEVADPQTPGNWQTFFAATTHTATTGGALTGWEVLDRTKFLMDVRVEHANPALRYDPEGGYWYCITARKLPTARWYFFTEISRSKDLRTWEVAPGMGSNVEVGRPLLAPNKTTDLALAPAQWTNARTEMLRKLLPFIMDVTDVNTSDMDLVEWRGETVMFFCAGQQHHDNVLVVAKSSLPLMQFLRAWFPAAGAPK